MKITKIVSITTAMSLLVSALSALPVSAHEIDVSTTQKAQVQLNLGATNDHDQEVDDADTHDGDDDAAVHEKGELDTSAEVRLDVMQKRIEMMQQIHDKLAGFATRSKTIGADLKSAAETHADIAAKLEAARTRVEARGKFKQFFIGTDWKNLGTFRAEYARNAALIKQLTELKAKTTDTKLQADIQAQIDSLTEVQANAEVFIKRHEHVFSVFGWTHVFFNK